MRVRLLPIIGFVLLILPFAGVYLQWSKLHGLEKTVGHVVRIEQGVSKKSTVYAAVVGYDDPAGRKHEIVSSVWSSWKPEIGDVRTVYFDPADSADAYIGGFDFWFASIVLSVISVAFAGIVFAKSGWERSRRKGRQLRRARRRDSGK